MGARNGYFKVNTNIEGTFLHLFPAEEGGEPINIDEVMNYLSSHKMNNYDLSKVNKAIQTGEETEVRLFKEKILPFGEEVFVTISPDGMRAEARFYPSANEPAYMDKKEILQTLQFEGVKYGIKEDAIDEFIKNREYCKTYLIAEGKPVIQGKDAKIEYHFNLQPNSKPKLNEDGSVDFHNLDNINRVKAGDVLATLEKEEYGVSGTNVSGGEILPRKVQILRLKYGKGIQLSEDELTLTSEIDGHVLLNQENKVIVSNTYEIDGNVDVSTGDIKYDGNVIVKGNVCTGFTIIASGNVEVEGVVEGARIIAQGQIILKRGIQGMGKGILQSQGVILAKFIESASVLTNSSITTESILYSQVSAKGEIHVSGKKSMIVGGHVRSAVLIETQVAGSAMGGNTILEVGSDPTVQDRMKSLEVEQKKLNTEKTKSMQLIEVYKVKQAKGQLPPDKIPEFQKVLQDYSNATKRLEEIEPELEKIYDAMKGIKDARIKIWKEAHAGVKLVIGEEVYYVNKMEHHSQFYLGSDRLVKRTSC